MKKYLLFLGSFAIVFIGLQILSGMLLTMFYTPSAPWTEAAVLSSEVEFGSTSFFSPLVIAFLALGAAFGVLKLFGKRVV